MSNTQIFNIPLKEKFNLPLRNIPIELIRAFCEGNIKAYYPKDSTKECSYHEFVAHFNAGACQPDKKNQGNEFGNIPCPNNFCNNNDENVLENFLFNIELIEEKKFNREKSVENYNVKYIKLKYNYDLMGNNYNLEGPLFRYNDVVELTKKYSDRYLVQNPKNSAENFSMRKIIESRMFSGNVISPNNQNSHYPEKKNNNKDDDRYHN
ncbi:MAG: hypothetical protein ACK5D5_09775 [Bacteroidota bacterium]|jgi:hypothetical protein